MEVSLKIVCAVRNHLSELYRIKRAKENEGATRGAKLVWITLCAIDRLIELHEEERAKAAGYVNDKWEEAANIARTNKRRELNRLD